MDYRSKERYTIEEVVDMGSTLIRVTDSHGMAIALLSQEEFDANYEQIETV